MLPSLDDSHATLPDALWRRQSPTPLRHPRLLDLNQPLLADLGFSEAQADACLWTGILGGEAAWPGSRPLAMKYGGHQFGGWNPDLGDGRGLLLGDLVTPDGRRVDIHLKGSGPTPFSRMGDGRAVLRSSVREYLAGEALHALGVPTSRVLALGGSDEPVRRERMETGATVLRVARTHIRFGHFEWLTHSGQQALLQPLADHVIAREYPGCIGHDRYVAFFREVVLRTARLMADWQRVGFAHGVMNTDNFSIAGETLDFGPYGFLETYNPHHICNDSDQGGRYAWHRQPSVGLWNLNALAQALVPLIPVPALKDCLAEYEPALITHYDEAMSLRLGLDGYREGDRELVRDWLQLLHQGSHDFSRRFRELARPLDGLLATLQPDWGVQQEQAAAWMQRYIDRVAASGLDEPARQQRVEARNPVYVLRNYLAEIAIQGAEAGDLTALRDLLSAVRKPFASQPGLEPYAGEAPAWGRCLTLSCSS